MRSMGWLDVSHPLPPPQLDAATTHTPNPPILISSPYSFSLPGLCITLEPLTECGPRFSVVVRPPPLDGNSQGARTGPVWFTAVSSAPSVAAGARQVLGGELLEGGPGGKTAAGQGLPPAPSREVSAQAPACASCPGDPVITDGSWKVGQGPTWRAGMRTQFTRYGLLVSSRDTKVRSWCLLLILSLSSERNNRTA